MQEKLETRLVELKAQYEDGQKMLVDLEAKRTNLQSTLLRISGAIQVLEEILNTGESTTTSEKAASDHD
jgi:hypothetical protein